MDRSGPASAATSMTIISPSVTTSTVPSGKTKRPGPGAGASTTIDLRRLFGNFLLDVGLVNFAVSLNVLGLALFLFEVDRALELADAAPKGTADVAQLTRSEDHRR